MNKDYPYYARIGNKKYKINTDFRNALECEKIATSDISAEERALAIIFKLFGQEGLNDVNNWDELLRKGIYFLKVGKTEETDTDEEPNISYEQDWGAISASFMSDYRINLGTVKSMHWWQFYDYLCGLTEKCVLSRIRFVRDFDLSKIKDPDEREKWAKQKRQVELKVEKTEEEKRLDELFEKQMKGE